MVLVSKSSTLASDLNRSLKVKIDSLKRLEKDYKYYQSELEEQKNKVSQFRNDSTKDEHDVNKQIEILDENKIMIIDTVTRIRDCLNILTEFLDDNADKNESLSQYDEALELVERLYKEYINE